MNTFQLVRVLQMSLHGNRKLLLSDWVTSLSRVRALAAYRLPHVIDTVHGITLVLNNAYSD